MTEYLWAFFAWLGVLATGFFLYPVITANSVCDRKGKQMDDELGELTEGERALILKRRKEKSTERIRFRYLDIALAFERWRQAQSLETSEEIFPDFIAVLKFYHPADDFDSIQYDRVVRIIDAADGNPSLENIRNASYEEYLSRHPGVKND